MVRPIGLVSVLAFIEAQARTGVSVRFTAPADPSHRSYLFHEGMNVEDYVVAAAVTAAGRLIDEDLAAKRTTTPWQFVDERWLRRHARRLHRYLRRHRQYIVTLHGEPVGYLLHPAASDGEVLNVPRAAGKRHR